LLAMVDVAPPRQDGVPETDPGGELARFVQDLGGLAGSGILPGPLPRLAPGAGLDEILSREDVQALLPDGFGPERVRELFRRFSANRRAFEAYRPGPWGGRVTLIRAEASPEGVDAWRELARGGAEVHTLPGDHYSLLQPPRVSRLSELLETGIRRALTKIV